MTVVRLAQMAGVSPSTVSRVLLNRPGVSEELRTKVRKIALDLGFRPNPGRQVARKQRICYRRNSGPQLFLPLLAA